MAQSSARRSFHGPLQASLSAGARKVEVKAPLELVPDPPRASAIGRAVLVAACEEAPSTGARERVLAGVLSALKCLTGSS